MVAKGYLLFCATPWVSNRTPLYQKRGREGSAELGAGRGVSGVSGRGEALPRAHCTASVSLSDSPLTRSPNVLPRVYLLFLVPCHQRVTCNWLKPENQVHTGHLNGCRRGPCSS